MNSNLEKVAEFHRTFEHPIGEGPTSNEPLEIRQLRIKLLFEELAELAEASDCQKTFTKVCADYFEMQVRKKQPDLVSTSEDYKESFFESIHLNDGDNVNKLEELDACCDIQYVLNGKILTAGLHEVFDKNFTIVHENNMTKAHRSEEHAMETVAVRGGLHTMSKKEEGKWLLFNTDGKLTKPHDHKKVQLTLE